MRALRSVVNDIARAMRRQAKRQIAAAASLHDHANCERSSAQSLIRYAELLEAATKRKTRKKVSGRNGRSGVADSRQSAPIEATR